MGAIQSSQNSKPKRPLSRSSFRNQPSNHEPLFTSITNEYDGEGKKPPKSRENQERQRPSLLNKKLMTRRKTKDITAEYDSVSKRPAATYSSVSPILSTDDDVEHKINYNRDIIEFHGRSYPARGKHKYILPIDDQEQDRLIQVHFLYKYLFDTNFLAPVKDLLSVNLSISSSLSSRRGTLTDLHLRRCSTGSRKSPEQQYIINSGDICINHRYNFMMLDQQQQHQQQKKDPMIDPLDISLPNLDWYSDTSPKVLDIACGNGIWIMEMATDFPDSQFFGIDINTNYPKTIKPPNTNFLQWDILNSKGVPFPNEYFDYIFMRQVYTCFSAEDWKTVMMEVKRLLKPGGYVEFRDLDPIIHNQGPFTSEILKSFPRLMKENYGVDVRWAKNMLDTLYDVGNMTDVHQQVIPLRFGALPASDPVGHMILRSLRLGLENYRLFYEKHQDLRKDVDFDIAIDTMLQEAVDYDSYMEYVCCWARKPLFETIDIAQTNVRRYSSGLLILNNIHNHSHDVNKMILQDLNNKDGDNSHDGDIIHEENVTDINQFVEGFYED